MNPLAPKIDNPLAAAAAHPLVAATKEQVAVTSKQPLVEYVRRSLELEDPEEVEHRADELTVIGYEKTADHLRRHAGVLRARRHRRGPMVYPSPFPEASGQQWAQFVRLMQVGDPAAVTPSGQVGIFQTRLKRLQDLGLARDVRRVNGPSGPRWTATFRAPLTLARLLGDPLLQYRIFVASMRRYRGETVDFTWHLPDGDVYLQAVEDYSMSFDPQACTAKATGTGTWVITGGTGLYANATGDGTFTDHGSFTGARDHGVCEGPDSHTPPRTSVFTLQGTGTATLSS